MTVCPYFVCGFKNSNLLSAGAGKRGTLDTIQNPVSLPKATAPERYQNDNRRPLHFVF